MTAWIKPNGWTSPLMRMAEVQNKPNKDGGGKGQWSAWKVSILLRSLVRGGLPMVGGRAVQGVRGRWRVVRERGRVEERAQEGCP